MLKLKKNGNYWQASKPYLDGAELLVIPESNSRVLKLQTLGRAGTIKTAVADVLRSDFVIMNTKKKPFDDVRVRQALNYAIDNNGPERGAMFKEMLKIAYDGAPSIFLFYPGASYPTAAMSRVSRCCRPPISAWRTSS